jgi:20S proteasome subunit alpha 7
VCPIYLKVTSGWVPDSLAIANKARSEAHSYKDFYDDAIPVRILNERVSNIVQMHTIYGHIRPFGCAVLLGLLLSLRTLTSIAGIDRSGPQLYMIEPSGLSWGYFGCAAGKAAAAARTQIEKLDLKNLTCKEAVVEAAKMYGVPSRVLTF